MVFEEWVAFQTGFYITIFCSFLIIVYFRIRERLYKLETIVRKFLLKDENLEYLEKLIKVAAKEKRKEDKQKKPKED